MDVKLRIASITAPVPEPRRSDQSVLEVWRDHRDGAVFAWAQNADGEFWMHLRGIASYRLSPGGGEVTAVPDPFAGSERVVSGYQRTVLPMAVQFGGREVLHASAVLTVGGVVTFCAVSETGKSTIAQAFGRRGYPTWADDAVAFQVADGLVTALPLPFQLPLRPRHGLDRGGLMPGASTYLPPFEAAPAPIRGVCVLERAAGRGRTDDVWVRQLSPAEAFPAVLAHAYCYSFDDVERNRRMVGHYLDLSARVPVISVMFGSGLERLPAVLDAIQGELEMEPGRPS